MSTSFQSDAFQGDAFEAGVAITGSVAITIGKAILAVSEVETFAAVVAIAVKKPALAVSETETFIGLAAITAKRPVLAAGEPPLPEVLPEGGPYLHEAGWRRRRRPVPEPIPVHIQAEPTVVELEMPELEPVPIADAAVDKREILVALFASGAISETEYVALLAA